MRPKSAGVVRVQCSELCEKDAFVLVVDACRRPGLEEVSLSNANERGSELDLLGGED